MEIIKCLQCNTNIFQSFYTHKYCEQCAKARKRIQKRDYMRRKKQGLNRFGTTIPDDEQ